MLTFNNPFTSIEAEAVHGGPAVRDAVTDLDDLQLGRWYLWFQSPGDTPVLIRRLDDARYVGVVRFAYTWGLIWGWLDDPYGYEDRWCYERLDVAVTAGHAWNGDTVNQANEPQGWHRHPHTGRRRKNGDPTTEYINL